jgi:hypothetical protein
MDGGQCVLALSSPASALPLAYPQSIATVAWGRSPNTCRATDIQAELGPFLQKCAGRSRHHMPTELARLVFAC